MLFNLEQMKTIERIAEIAVNSGYYQYAAGKKDGRTAYKNLTIDQAISIIMTGVELGVGPMTALRNITPYRTGKPPIMSAHLESALAQAHGFQIVEISKSETHVELAIERNGQRLGTYPLTLDQIRKENKNKLEGNWITNPLDMLLKTAKVRLVRTYASQAHAGAMYILEEMPQHVTNDTYTAEELGSDDDTGYTEPEDTPAEPDKVIDLPAPGDRSEELPGDTEPDEPVWLPPPAYVTEDFWSNYSKEKPSRKGQKAALAMLAKELWPDDEGTETDHKGDAVEQLSRGSTRTTKELTEYEAETLRVMFTIEKLGRELYGDDWILEKRVKAVSLYTGPDNRVPDLYLMDRKDACRLQYRLQRDLLEAEAEIA